jgi:quercetin dioxygenase-like cupin family protein
VTGPSIASVQWSMDELRSELAAALEREPDAIGQWVHGRVIGVLASPELESASHLAVGVAALPAGFSTAAHSHEAEEVAVILSGRGRIEIEGAVHRVEAGSVVLTPARAEHVTSADADGPLLVLWMYAPAGSEQRWLAPQSENGRF